MPSSLSPSAFSRRAARVAVAAATLALLLLFSLHALRPDLEPAGHMLSEYALGAHGWVMSLCFASFAVSSAALLLALARHSRGRLARLGQLFLFLASVGLVLGALFPTDPPRTPPDAFSFAGRMHGIGFMIGVPSELLTVLLLSLTLRKEPEWQGLVLLALAAGLWLSLGVMVPLIIAQHGFGIPNRLFMASFAAWLSVAAWPLARSPNRPR